MYKIFRYVCDGLLYAYVVAENEMWLNEMAKKERREQKAKAAALL